MSPVALNTVATMISQRADISSKTNKKSEGFDTSYKEYIKSNKDTVTKRNNLYKNETKANEGVHNEDMSDKKINKDSLYKESINTTTKVKKIISEDEEISDDDTIIMASDVELIENLELNLLNDIANILDISLEELQGLMETKDIHFIDLFEGENIQTLLKGVLNINSEEQLLTNEQFMNLYKEINDKLQMVLADQAINLEQFKEILQTNLNNQSIKEEANHPIVVESNSNEQLTEKTTIDNENKDNKDNKVIDLEIIDNRNESTKNNQQNSKESETSSQKDNLNDVITNIETKVMKQVSSFGEIKEIIYQKANAQSIINQVVTNVKVVLNNNSSTMAFQLQPENLGKVAFSVTSENGVMTGNFVAESQTVKEAIEMNLVHLKASLEEQGIKMDEIKVVIGNTNSFMDNNQKNNNGYEFFKSSKRSIKSIEGITELVNEEEDVAEEIINDDLDVYSHSVDYIA